MGAQAASPSISLTSSKDCGRLSPNRCSLRPCSVSRNSLRICRMQQRHTLRQVVRAYGSEPPKFGDDFPSIPTSEVLIGGGAAVAEKDDDSADLEYLQVSLYVHNKWSLLYVTITASLLVLILPSCSVRSFWLSSRQGLKT